MTRKRTPSPRTQASASGNDPFRLLFLRHPVPTWVCDVKTLAFLEVNDAAVRRYGYARDEFLAMSLKDIGPPEGLGEGGEGHHRVKGGRVIDVRINSSLLAFRGREATLVSAEHLTERDAPRAPTDVALREGDRGYRSLFDNMLEGFAYCQMLFDRDQPHDFVYLEVNKAFEALTGLKNVVGRKVSEVIPGIRESNPELFEIYGRVAVTGKPERFETYVEPLGVWFSLSVYSPAREYFVATFDNITDRKRGETALRESEERYRVIAESVSDAIVTIDQNSRIIRFANEAVGRILGYSSAELVGQELTVLMPERYRDDHREGVKRYAETGVKHFDWRAKELTGLHKNGSEILLEVSYGEYTKDTERYFVGVMRDVTELRQREVALKLFRTLIDRSNDLIEVVDPATGRFVDVNERGCLDLGYGREEFLALSVPDIDPTVDRASFAKSTNELRKSGVLMWEGIHRRKNGSTFPVEVRISLVQLDRDYAVAVVRDITERKRAERELQETRDRLQRAVSAGNVGLWDWDLRGNQAYYSSEWKRQIGYAEHEIANDFDEWQTRLHPDDRDRVLQVMQANLATPGPGFELEFRCRHKDGSYRHFLVRASVLRDEHGQPIHLLGSRVDITERIQLQAQFLQAQKMESVGRLAGGVAHDFNNLLTIINGTAELGLVGLREGDPLYADLQEVRQAGERAAALTRQLLAFSRRQVLQPQVLSLNAVVGDMEGMLRRLIGEDVDLAFVPAEDLGRVKVDPGQVEQVLLNLAVNSRDAMPEGGTLTIATRNVELDETYAAQHSSVVPGLYVMLAISDTGVGMDEATRARIFEPFFTTKDPGRGTGLGLSTVYGIVKQSGGSIWVYSEIGKGTTFRVYLPRVEEAVDTDRPVRTSTVARGTETLLLVEDEEGLRHLAERVLKSAGYTVLVAANGGEGLLLLERHDGPVHLMLTDIVMPGMSGQELAERLQETRPEMKVLYSSGYTDDAILRHGVLDDKSHFISKPYSIVELTRKVREVLDWQG